MFNSIRVNAHPIQRWLAFVLITLCGWGYQAKTQAQALQQASPGMPAIAARQDATALQHAIEQFIQTQTMGLPGEVQVNVSSIDKRLNLAECVAPEVFLPTGSRAWGKTTVGVKCTTPSNWTIYVQASIKVFANYVVSALPLTQGQVVGLNDLTTIRGDLTALPPGILTDPQQAVGRTLGQSIPSGAPLRQDALKNQSVVQQGQSVRVVSNGPGFQVTADGHALGTAADGQVVQARIASGQVVSGIARNGGLIEVSY